MPNAMRAESLTSSFLTKAGTGIAILGALFHRVGARLKRLSRRLLHWLRRFWSILKTGSRTVLVRTRRGLKGPVRRVMVGPVRTGLLGRRPTASLLTAMLAPILALGTAQWVVTVGGYPTLEQWVHGTWWGTDPSMVVFLGTGLLLGLGVVSAALNSGLLPTTLLVSAPVFGIAITRYGMSVTSRWGTSVVSLPEAVSFATVMAVAFGIPLGLASFVLGAAVRRLLELLDYGRGSRSNPDRV